MALGTYWTLYLFLLLALTSLGYLAIRRLLFHSLSGFPGPRLAAVSSLYKTYFEVAKGGELLHQIYKLHEQYGPVVRIGPNELHFKDHQAYSQIFSLSAHLTKDPDFYMCFGVGSSTFGAIDPELARARRDVINPFFTRRAILRLEDVIHSKVDKLIELLLARSEPSDMFLAYRCTTMDIITTHCFGKSSNVLDAEDFRSSLLLDIQTTVPFLWTMKSFGWVLVVLPLLPSWVGGELVAQYRAFLRLQAFITRQISDVAQDKTITVFPDSLYHWILDSQAANDCEIETASVHEALSLLQAGSDTVANTCNVGTLHVLNNPDIHAKLSEELKGAWPNKDDALSLTAFEKLPYLTAVIKESLRISHGFVSSLPRKVGPLGAEIAGLVIPPSTVVGISATCLHTDPNLFPDPNEFCPDRWLQPNSRDLNQYLVPFSRGSRMCVGINMAWAELYIIFGSVFRKLDITLYDTSLDDFANFKDYFVPVHTGKHLHILAKQSSF